MFRIGKDNPAAGKLRGGEVDAMGARKMRGFYFVEEPGCSEKDFKAWIAASLAYARALPPKSQAATSQGPQHYSVCTIGLTGAGDGPVV